eukprot:gene11066-11222_t
MALAAANLGVTVKCLDPAEDAPAAVAAQHTVGHFRDAAAIAPFAAGCDVLTVEIEHIDADAMEQAGRSSGVALEPTPQTLRVIQDKFAQKQHFAAAGVPAAPFADVPDETALAAAAQEFGFPFMLKSKRLAYDGRGNFVIKGPGDLTAGVQALGGFSHGLYAEKWAPFVKELAVMVVRSSNGSVVSYPVVETIHKDNICHVTEAPAGVPAAIQQRAQQVAEKAVACLYGAGIFGVEMFLLPDGTLLLNEVAPRPHNSGHYTMDGCITSQFENHIRAVLGWPLGDTSLNCGSCLMLNMLGEADDDHGIRMAHDLMAKAYQIPGERDSQSPTVTVDCQQRDEGRQKLAALDPTAAESLRRSDEAARKAGIAQAAAGAGASNSSGRPKVGIIMGSDSDLPTMKAAEDVLKEFGVACELTIVSAHRTPERMMSYARTAHQRGLQPSGAYLDGMDALLSIVQMPRGVPVATVAIGNAANAGLLAVRVLAGTDAGLLQQMLDYQLGMKEMVLGKAAKVEAERGLTVDL